VTTVGAAGGVAAQRLLGTPPGGWEPLGIGTGPDDRTRVLWRGTGRTTSGRIAVWTLSPSLAIEGVASFGPRVGWDLAGFAIGPADGKPRLLWQGAAGPVALWTMNAAGTSPESTMTFSAPVGWVVRTVSVDGVNRIRLFGNDTTGRCALWTFGPGGALTGTRVFGPPR
jgi:hypothetical protein